MTEEQPAELTTSPPGRHESPSEEALHEVWLLGVPLQVLAAAREHHDEVMREFALLALDESSHPEQLPARLLELVDLLGRRYAGAAARPEAAVEEALARGELLIDLLYDVPAHVTEAASQLEALLVEADEFARSSQLLSLARERVVAEFSTWYLEQFHRQIAGQPPQRWTGPLQP